MEKAGPFDCSVSDVAISLLVSGLTLEILGKFDGVFMVQCVKLMLRIFEFGVLLFVCFVYCQNKTRLKCFARYGHYAGEVEDINPNHMQTCSCLSNHCTKR